MKRRAATTTLPANARPSWLDKKDVGRGVGCKVGRGEGWGDAVGIGEGDEVVGIGEGAEVGSGDGTAVAVTVGIGEGRKFTVGLLEAVG